MTSGRKKRANRANSRKSTGPRTALGKQRAARNSLRHGLNIPVLYDPTLAPRVEALADSIAGETPSILDLLPAQRIAEAQVELRRVRERKRDLIAIAFADQKYETCAGPEKLAAIIDDNAEELHRLDRYERRALSARKFAIREFSASKRSRPHRAPSSPTLRGHGR
jgi:hypothetical protein